MNNQWLRLTCMALLGFLFGFYVAQSNFQTKPPSSLFSTSPAAMHSRNAKPTAPAEVRSYELNENQLGAAGITKDDLAEMDRLSAAARNGEYSLDVENPVLLKLRAEAKLNMKDRLENPFQSKLLQKLNDYGIKPELAEQVARHRSKIGEASGLASSALIEYQKAQQTYLARLSSSLTTEQLKDYHEFENSQKSIYETERINGIALSTTGTPLSDTAYAALQRAILNTEAYTIQAGGSPYDPTPSPTYGNESTARRMREIGENVQRTSKNLVDCLSQANLTEGEMTLVRSYYESFVHKLLVEGPAEMEKRLAQEKASGARTLPFH